MSRRIKSPTRTISSRGPYPRFIGYFPCHKSKSLQLPFDSVTALKVGIHLERRPNVVLMEFEPEELEYIVDGEPETCIPDYRLTINTGEMGWAEAKHDEAKLSAEDAERFRRHKALANERGMQHEVLFQKTLEKDGELDTVILLRRYAQLEFPRSALTRAEQKLKSAHPLSLREYEARARATSIYLSVVYYLLYHQRLPLLYKKFTLEEMELCRV